MQVQPSETDARLHALEEHVEALALHMSRIEKALEDLALWADGAYAMDGMAKTIRHALNNLRP